MQTLINSIQSGNLTTNQILEQLTTLHNNNCDEVDAYIDRIKALELKETNLINHLSKMTVNRNLFQNKLTVADAQLKFLNQYKAENKKLKPRAIRLRESNAQYLLRNETLQKTLKTTELTVLALERENAKLRITGHKTVGKYEFTIFPVKVSTNETNIRKVALCIYTAEGCMKILTRGINGDILQPKSHNFKFNQEELKFMNDFFDVAEAHNNRFDDAVLRLVK